MDDAFEGLVGELGQHDNLRGGKGRNGSPRKWRSYQMVFVTSMRPLAIFVAISSSYDALKNAENKITFLLIHVPSMINPANK